ncbi:hypothetical protein Vadar_024234 [Vaccinium darrowii]|uniref:Uncharacterized protein n=1 Tax=Vaccinium darrowii TaxID=229202 RepID=A0ACB7XT00_9ERIC|nr:hypothetical protein Vadar_024234 [Vaccinium darrowii]
MDSSLYNAASQGEVDVLRRHIDQLEIQTTANRNTALHVAAQFGQLQCADMILEECPSLLGRVNIRGETPLHMAAREGYADIVKKLIEFAKQREQLLESGFGGEGKKMLRATNVDKDTALHMAVRNRYVKEGKYLEVIKLLTEEDREFEHPANNDDETPLYLAVERGSVDVVKMLLTICTSPTFGGPGGRTALHAATFKPSWKQGNDEMVIALSEWKPDLIREPDTYGWTPLHCAARFRNNLAAKKLLEKDKSVAYIAADGDEGHTALHIAAAVGSVRVMEKLLSYCPDCWEMVNNKGQNILHIAAYYKLDQATDFILEKPWVTHLINQKDNEGNTPLHLLASKRSKWLDLLASKRSKWLDEYPGADAHALNNENWTPHDIRWGLVNSKRWPRHALWGNGRDTIRKDRERIIKWKMSKEQIEREKEQEKVEGKKRFEGIAKTHMVVATLVATISFAASFTIPGGYRQEGRDEGKAVLVRLAAFKAFVITNTIAVICSTSSVFLYLSASLHKFSYEGDEKVKRRYLIALWLVIIALVAMTIAFITGTYAMLGHSLGLVIATCVIACSSFIVYASELIKLIRKMLGLESYQKEDDPFVLVER